MSVTTESQLAPCSGEVATYQNWMKDGKKKMIIQAVKDRELEIVRRAVRAGGDTNTADGYGNTLLHYAAYFGSCEIVKFLATGYAVIDAENNTKSTPLHLACETGQADVVALLVNACGANVNARNMNGWTPLYYGCWGGHVPVCQVLVRTNGIDLQPANRKVLSGGLFGPQVTKDKAAEITDLIQATLGNS